jgi:hypothetical protein
VQSSLVGGESQKVNKPSTPNTKEIAPESLKPPSSGGANSSPSTGGAPSLSARAALSLDPAGTSSSPEPFKSPKTFPTSPQSYGLRAAGGYQPSEDLSMPQREKQA